MRSLIWAVLSATVIVSAVRAQTAVAPDPPKSENSPPKHIVIEPPALFFHPCNFVLTGNNSHCPPPVQPTVCMAGEKRCTSLSKAPGQLVPI